MKLQIPFCLATFVIVGAVLIAWNAAKVKNEKKTVSEAFGMLRGFAIGYLVCAFACVVATLIELSL